MMLAVEGDVPQEPTAESDPPKTHSLYKAEKTADGSVKLNLIQHYAPKERIAMKTENMGRLKALWAQKEPRAPISTPNAVSEHSHARRATDSKEADQGAEHYELATPPSAPHYPKLNSKPIPRQVERTIAQRNRAAANSNAESLFGKGLSSDQRNPAAEKRNMIDLFGEEVESAQCTGTRGEI